jgi:hypothetical protein
MRCLKLASSLLISFLVNVASTIVVAQVLTENNAIKPKAEITIPPFRPFSILLPKPDLHPAFPKNLTIESFGYGPGPLAPGYQFSPGYTAAFFNLQGLECPGCVMGPVNRAKFTLPPFGAKAKLKLWDDRIELFSGFAALEAWKPDGAFEPRGLSLFSSSYGDAWLAQMEAGGQISLDRTQHVWVGATGRHLSNFGPGQKDWNSFGGSATFVFGHH